MDGLSKPRRQLTYRDLFQDWLLHPAVLHEFCTLLAPDHDSTLDLDRLHEQFEDSGLNRAPSGRNLVRRPGHGYGRRLSTSPLPWSRHYRMHSKLSYCSNWLNAWELWSVWSVRHSARWPVRQRAAHGPTSTNTPISPKTRPMEKSAATSCCRKISQVLTDASQHGSAERMLAAYQQSELALTRVGLPTSTSSRGDTSQTAADPRESVSTKAN